jgi:hypothetical protein
MCSTCENIDQLLDLTFRYCGCHLSCVTQSYIREVRRKVTDPTLRSDLVDYFKYILKHHAIDCENNWEDLPYTSEVVARARANLINGRLCPEELGPPTDSNDTGSPK